MLVEAKGVQRYIFDSGPLRDLVGASDLVAGLASSQQSGARDTDMVEGDLIGQVLTTLEFNVPDDVRFSRRAAGAFCLHANTRAPLDRVRALYLLAASLKCPGLELSVAGPVSAKNNTGDKNNDVTALKNAYKSGSAIRANSAAALPPSGHPLTAFNPRTGRLVNALFRYKDNDLQPGDVLTTPQRIRAQQLQGELDGVASRYLAERTDETGREYVFPRNLETKPNTKDNPSFPFEGDDRRIAVIHADLSGLGQTFRKITDHADEAYKILVIANAIETAIETSAKRATTDVLIDRAQKWEGDNLAVIPARPVVLGGDDLTILVRADLALAYAKTLLQQIEAETQKLLHPFRTKDDPKFLSEQIPEKLTACAGIAIVKAGQPFLMAHALAESLCSFAKKAAKAGGEPFASGLAFHNTQSTLREDYREEILKRELTAEGLGGGEQNVILTGNPYLLNNTGRSEYKQLDSLEELVKALADAPRGRGKLIEAARALFDDRPAAKKLWARWRDTVDDEQKGARDKVDNALKSLGITDPETALHQVIGPITDALELIDLAPAMTQQTPR